MAYEERNRAKTTNIGPISDVHGYIIAYTHPIAGHHHNAFHLTPDLQTVLKSMKRLGLDSPGAYFNGACACDTKAAPKVCFDHGVIASIAQSRRNRTHSTRPRVPLQFRHQQTSFFELALLCLDRQIQGFAHPS